LPFQNLEEISVIGLTPIRIALRQSLGNSFSNRASPASIGILPGKTILFPCSTDDPLRVLIHFGSIMLFLGILFLRLDISPADLNHIQFVGAYASKENLLTTSLGVE
jgi:hypothetical protein